MQKECETEDCPNEAHGVLCTQCAGSMDLNLYVKYLRDRRHEMLSQQE